MKILYLTNELNYACGVSTHLLNLISGLLKHHDIGIHIISGGGNGVERFNNNNINVNINPNFLHENRSALNFTKAVSYLVKYANDNLIDIIHSHTHYAANIAHYSAGFIKIPTIQTNHGILSGRGKLTHFNADRYIAINEHIFDYLKNVMNVQPECISFIRCGIPVPDKPPVKESKKLKIVLASRLTHDKGTDIFINAVLQLKIKEKEKCEFYIAGTGDEEMKLKEFNNTLKAGIKFLGRVDDMPGLLSTTHITVFCGRSVTEGFPAIITEAGAFNNLVISSDFNGLQPAFEADKDGLVFKNDDAEILNNLLSMVIERFDIYKTIALNYYQKVKNIYSITEMINKHLALYNSCLKR